MGLAAVGLCSVLRGCCPVRLLFLAGEGNTDSAMAGVGMLVGAAVYHNFGLASSTAGATPAGGIACVLVLLCMAAIALCHLPKKA